MKQDIRYALRMLRSQPLFTAMAVLSLALGIGANTAIFSFMDAILLRALPVAHPESLVLLNWHSKDRPEIVHSINGSTDKDPKLGFTCGNFPYSAYERFHAETSVFSSLFGFYDGGNLTVQAQGQAGLGATEYVTGEFFQGLGVLPSAGRLIDARDDLPGAPLAAVLGHAYAQRRFGAPASAVGQTILVNNVAFTVAGVAAPAFLGVDPGFVEDVYVPMHSIVQLQPALPPDPPNRLYIDNNFYWMRIMARLLPGVTAQQAQAAAGPGFGNLVRAVASTEKERADLPALYLRDGGAGLDFLRRQYARPLYVLMTLVALILAIACANLANLLMARATGRRREIALRLSLGAGRLRMVRQLLTESVLLASLGGLLGVAFAAWGVRLLTLLIVNGRENFSLGAELNGHVLALTIGLSLLTGMLFGLAPALQSLGVDLNSALRQSRGGDQRRRYRGRALVISQIAVSLLLLVAANLFVRTLTNLNSIALGFNSERLLLFSVNARQAGYRDSALVRFYQDLQARLESVPGVRAVSSSNRALVSQSQSSTSVRVPGYTGKSRGTSYIDVGPGFFAAMQIPVLLGREIDERDIRQGAAVAVVNEVFVATYFGGQNPVGKRFHMNSRGTPPELEIVGVARNARYASLKGEIPPLAYVPYSQNLTGLSQMVYELRAAGPPLSLVQSVRQIVQQADSRIPVFNIVTQAERIDQTISQERTFATLCTCFAVLAVLIACVGLYGTMAYNVARRTNEIGIRMALGAQRRRLMWMVLREVLGMAAVGLTIGLCLALWVSRAVETLVFQVKPTIPRR